MKAAMLGSDAVERSGPPQAPNKGKGKPPWRSEGLPGTPGGRPKINWWRFIVTLLVVYAGFFVVSSFVDSGSVETISLAALLSEDSAPRESRPGDGLEDAFTATVKSASPESIPGAPFV